MYGHTFYFDARKSPNPTPGHTVDCQPGDCRWLFNIPQWFVWVYMYWLKYSL